MSVWEVRLSTSRNVPYFFNRETNQSVWDTPPGLSPSDLLSLPGAELLSGGGSGGGSAGARPSKVRASHLLVKHSGSRRPSSWKEKSITRSKEDAVALLRRYETQIGGSTDKFAELARANSDCSSHDHGGDLGWFTPGQMQKPFEDAAYALKVGQISDVVSTDSGVHLILRTG
ncbi:rotamase-domain-containing protein [Auriscalpium vulgare]|uniref:Rotamase-domain-containing protein n=1 Tax=Auriscalpium vulgare TaxID=40419 RepID=A0ACB8R9T7_9AGAM|nr:rotamase-domain-containing protein [Auriscalpium vulgare]